MIKPLALFLVTLAGMLCLPILPVHAAPPTARQQQIQADGIISNVVDTLWDQTDAYWHSGDYPRIVALDRVITEADPQFLEAYSNGGWLMDSLGRTADAEAYYTLGTRNNPHAEYAYWNLGFFYFNTPRNYLAAAQAFQMAVRLPGADVRDWKMLGHSCEKSKRWDDALSVWQQARSRYPHDPSIPRLLAEMQAKRSASSAGKP